MRVVVKLSPSLRELVADLEEVPPRDRAERLRTLAAIGLTLMKGQAVTGDAAGPRAGKAVVPAGASLAAFKLIDCVAEDIGSA